MNSQRLAIGLTAINLVILLSLLLGAKADTPAEIAPVMRCRGLEIVDEQNRVRASIKIYPATPNTKMPDGTIGYPESVLLRLINSKGAPNVKIAATEDGSVSSFVGESNPTYFQIGARGDSPYLKLVNKVGRENVIKVRGE